MLKFLLDSKSTIFLIILIYLLLATFNINYPGLNTDETTNGVVSNYILKDASSVFEQGMQIVPCYIIIFGKMFPIMAGEYYGAIIPYLIYPFIRIFGLNSISLRFSSIFILAIFLTFVYKLCKIWFGNRVGLLAALLTATNLVFVQYSRVGLFRCEIFVMFFFWMGLFYLIKYSQKKKYSFLCLSFFFFGLGLSTKITFLYYIVALTLAYLITGKRLNLLGLFNIKKAIIMLLSFCLGSFFIIVYNIKEPWKTIKLLLAVLIDPSATRMHTAGFAANNWLYLNNLSIRLADFFNILKGDISSRFDWGVAEASPIEIISPLITSLTVISLFSVLFLVFFSPNVPKIIKQRTGFLYIIYLVVFLLTPFTLSSFDQGHLLILLPFPQVVLALFLYYVWQQTKQSRVVLVRNFSGFLIVLILLFNISMNIYFNIQMKKTGGYRRWSTAVVELAGYLQKNDIISPVMFGFGLHTNLMFLTDNKIIPVIYVYPQPIVSEYKQLFLNNEQIFYLTMASEKGEPEDENVYYRNLFMRFIKESGKKKELDKLFINRAGHPVYLLYKIY